MEFIQGLSRQLKDTIDLAIGEVERVNGYEIKGMEAKDFPDTFYEFNGRKIPVIIKDDCPEGAIYFITR